MEAATIYYSASSPWSQEHFGATAKSKSPIEMTWSDGGIRPSHPDIIPANEDIGGTNSSNGVLIIGEKGIIYLIGLLIK